MLDLHTLAFALDNMGSPLTIQPPVLMNRFVINLRSLSSPDLSQGGSARQLWSRFSEPNFRIPDSKSFLGNIGEDLQYGHESADDDYTSNDQTMDTVCPNTEDSPGAELEEASTTPGSSISRPVDTQVSLQIPSGSN